MVADGSEVGPTEKDTGPGILEPRLNPAPFPTALFISTCEKKKTRRMLPLSLSKQITNGERFGKYFNERKTASPSKAPC